MEVASKRPHRVYHFLRRVMHFNMRGEVASTSQVADKVGSLDCLDGVLLHASKLADAMPIEVQWRERFVSPKFEWIQRRTQQCIILTGLTSICKRKCSLTLSHTPRAHA